MAKVIAVSILLVLALGGCTPPSIPSKRSEQLQSMIASSPGILDAARLQALIPYSSISFERTMCFGPCPVYMVTFSRSGKATLVEDQFSEHPKRSTGTIDMRTYGRLAQLIDAARETSKRSEYQAQWTDAYTAKIAARTAAGAWVVSDYGEVAPAEIWALEKILDQMRHSTKWTPVAPEVTSDNSFKVMPDGAPRLDDQTAR